jgi:hypothetical protein
MPKTCAHHVAQQHPDHKPDEAPNRQGKARQNAGVLGLKPAVCMGNTWEICVGAASYTGAALVWMTVARKAASRTKHRT